MPIGINDLDFDDEFEDYGGEEQEQEEQDKAWMEHPNVQYNQEEPEEPEQPSYTEEEDDLITYMLKSKGITDPSKIKFEGENGEIEELNFNDLSREEQIAILSQNEQEEQQDEYSDQEIALINKLRQNKLTPEEYEQYLIRQGANNYAQQLEDNNKKYTIDDLEDDDLFILDLQARIEDITDEEALAALEKAKMNEGIYAKQIKGIREEYKRIEDEKLQRDQYEADQQRQQQFDAFSSQVQDSIRNFTSIGQLDISLNEDDMEDVAQFLLTADGAGINHFSKALNDPDTLVKMAWFALKGEEAFNDITNYFTAEIKKREQASYQRGLADAKKPAPSTSKFVYQPKNNNINPTGRKGEISIHDLD